MKIALSPIDSIKPYSRNARVIPQAAVEKVALSLKEYGFQQPIVIDKEGVIIAGHTRLQAAQMLNMTQVPTVTAETLTPAQVKAYRLMDNRSHQESHWEDQLLGEEMVDLLKDGIDLTLTGFDLNEIDDLLYQPLEDEPQKVEKATYGLFTQEQIIGEAFKVFRERGYPYPCMDLFEMMIELNKLKAMPKDALERSSLGYGIADSYHNHRFEASAIGMRSPVEGFKDDKALKKVLKIHLESTGNLEYKKLGFMSLVNGVQECANFRPAYAKLIIDTWCAEGGALFDSSTGYGGRLVGFLASHAGTYIGTDPNVPTYQANLAIANDLGAHKDVILYNSPIEDLDVSKHVNTIDLCFTSPPYFVKEQYSQDDTQSCVRYKTYEAWREGFLRPMLTKQFLVMRKGARNIVNIEDVTVKGKTYPLVADTIAIAKEIGFIYEKTDKFSLPTPNIVCGREDDEERFESVLVFRK